MNQAVETHSAAGWRRRHPALSRSLLYGAVLLLLAGLGFAWMQRKKQERFDFLAARLGALDVLAVADRTGDEVDKVLDEVFAEPDLPDDLRQRALRARALNHLKRGETDAALADVEEAATLATSLRVRQATALEHAQALISAERAEEALTELDGVEPDHPALVIWKAMILARGEAATGSAQEAVRTLDAALEALPRPLPEAPPVEFSLTPWTPVVAAIHATKSLQDLTPSFVRTEPWTRLLELAPRDLVAALEAAKALARGGHEGEAARAWAWAVSLNGGQAPEIAVSQPDLAALEKKRVEGLKAKTPGGR